MCKQWQLKIIGNLARGHTNANTQIRNIINSGRSGRSLIRCRRTNCKGTLGLIHEPFLRTNLLLSRTYEDFTKIVAFMNFFLMQDFS